MIRVLAIGNSFSQDATHYLHQIAAADQVNMQVMNLYIGGCSLERHWNNILSEAEDYLCEVNGESTGNYISIQQALRLEDWDYVVTQQASHDSGLPETYHPYLENMANYIHQQRPAAQLLLQQTWAYEIDSLHVKFGNYGHSQEEMYQKLSAAYKNAAQLLGVRLIPCGDVIQALRKKEPFLYNQGGMSLCRDGFHMNVIYGRYLLAAVWYRTLTGNSVRNNSYIPATKLAPNVVCNERILDVVRQSVDELL